MPKRIQRKRTKGWKMPEGAVYVGRPTKWGNPWKRGECESRAGMLIAYRGWAEGMAKHLPGFLDELRGKDLACFCCLDEPCHADILLELANPQPERTDHERVE